MTDVYKSFAGKKILQGFSLEVNEGETVVILGFSGSGKSVAIKHIVGLLTPDRGSVKVDGLEVPTLPRAELYELRSHIGYVFQFAALFDSLSVAENVAMGLVKRDVVRACGSSIGASASLTFFTWAPKNMTASTEALMNCMADDPNETNQGAWATDSNNFPPAGPLPWSDGTCAKFSCTSAE